MLFIHYPKCSTCQKAKKWLDEHNLVYTERHIVEENPQYAELKAWYQQSGLPLKKFFNTSGLLYKEMQLKDKLPAMSDEEQLQLLATNGMLVKRPLIVTEDIVLVGFKEAEWAEKLNQRIKNSPHYLNHKEGNEESFQLLFKIFIKSSLPNCTDTLAVSLGSTSLLMPY